jgi:hypothetical protein
MASRHKGGTPSPPRLGYTVVSSQLEIGVNQRSSAVKHQLPVHGSELSVLSCGLRPSDCRFPPPIQVGGRLCAGMTMLRSQ